jgi:hypothetical protein
MGNAPRNKSLFAVLLFMCASMTALPQGSVRLSNFGGQPVISCIDGTPIPTGSTYQMELMYAPDGTSSTDFEAFAVRIGNAGNFGPIPGFFSAGNRTVYAISPAGGFGLFQVRVWTSAYGNSFADVLARGDPNSKVGKSEILRVDTADPTIFEPAASLVTAGLGQIGVNWGDYGGASCVPEPSAVTIAIIGTVGVSLILRLRRQACSPISKNVRNYMHTRFCMKKLFVALVLAISAVTNAFSQGSVVFSNAGGQPVVCANGSRIPVGSTYQAELMYAPDGTATLDYDYMAIRIGAPANFGPVAGFFSGGGRTIDSITPAGGFGLFQVRVWATAFGRNYDEVVAFGFGDAGKSAIVRVDTGNPLVGEPAVSLVAAGLPGFFVGGLDGGGNCIPEPSVITIGLVAGAVLLLTMHGNPGRQPHEKNCK